jgi:SulP family sulfate permease
MADPCASDRVASREEPVVSVRGRAAPRHKFPVARLARVALPGGRPVVSGWTVDISTGGIGLLLPQPVPAGTRITVQVAVPAGAEVGDLTADVAHSTERHGGKWLVGCRLHVPLREEQVEALLAGGRIERLVHMFVPKSLVCLKTYSWRQLGSDLVAGVVVGLVALPLAMAFAIGSGVTPERGLYTAIVAGLLISLLGGSRVAIGGPTGAFVVIVYGIVAKHGYDGLVLATVMAGVLLIVMGLSRLGAAVKFIPYPVTTGFTSGIAVVIFSSQVNDLLGLRIEHVPADFWHKWDAYYQHLGNLSWQTAGLSAVCLAILIAWPRLTRKVPGALVVLVVATLLTYGLGLQVETIGSRFGGIPHVLPAPRLPDVSLARMRELLGPAATIAILAAIESLLCAVVADGMIGGRHKPNMELVAQGVANIASPLFGGIPATGAIARTATSVKAGGRTPVAGVVHALTLLVIMLVLAPLAVYVPLCALAAVLVVVSYGMAEIGAFAAILRAPRQDAVVLIVTFVLTVVFDLTVGVQIGLLLAAILFIKRMADVANVQMVTRELSDPPNGDDPDPNSIRSRQVPPGVEVYEVNGPFFFGVADKVKDVLGTVTGKPKVFILRMRNVPAMDATGLHALVELRRKCAREGCTLVLAEIHTQPFIALDHSGHREEFGGENVTAHIDDALNRARQLLGLPETADGTPRVPEVARDRRPSA